MWKSALLIKACCAIALLIGFYACERNDAEPNLEMRKFTRLYVSFEQYNTSSLGVPDTNMRTIYPADSSEFNFTLKHVSQAKGGGPIYFHPRLEALFQASANLNGINDTAVYSMSVGATNGVLQNLTAMENRTYSAVRGLAFHEPTNSLFIVNGSGINAGIYVVNSPKSRRGYVPPLKRLRTPGLQMWGAAYANNRLFTSRLGSGPGINVFNNIAAVSVPESDSTINNFAPARVLQIADARNLRGISYDTVKNVLAVAEFGGDGSVVGSGRILIFDNFSSLIDQEGSTITPTRIITGAATKLQAPVDVVIDPRESGVYLYVADRSARAVFRFRIDDQGNTAPNQEVSTGSRTPVGLALDARDYPSLGQ
ncbi:NHL repeat-containing protein [Sphingobacterium griseoflavum]|uniref:Lipoprotein n=1 Tax=Sphingobacterium griseoflavum TaxID=1474952 RepID=A0ABQ3HTW4_9SPHI|nr:hypothetical protein [Sphingobacterium griseoflavum]GHE23632.1 hypothetical protein GCM10017764_06000 [Sphingobacterium griseoflavum]